MSVPIGIWMYTIAWFGMFSGKKSVFGGNAPRSIPEKMSNSTVPEKNTIGMRPFSANARTPLKPFSNTGRSLPWNHAVAGTTR
ncbi:MAG: Uncharacterised protein [Cryomorphaceae bacterium]|nr:MAG: Uncharacterised protein [Cryomorphaceae bacterium]